MFGPTTYSTAATLQSMNTHWTRPMVHSVGTLRKDTGCDSLYDKQKLGGEVGSSRLRSQRIKRVNWLPAQLASSSQLAKLEH